jgi:hypothetical protein
MSIKPPKMLGAEFIDGEGNTHRLIRRKTQKWNKTGFLCQDCSFGSDDFGACDNIVASQYCGLDKESWDYLWEAVDPLYADFRKVKEMTDEDNNSQGKVL